MASYVCGVDRGGVLVSTLQVEALLLERLQFIEQFVALLFVGGGGGQGWPLGKEMKNVMKNVIKLLQRITLNILL